MIDLGEWFRSVEVVWVLWLGSIAGLALATLRRPAGGRFPTLGRLVTDEEGSAYALSYVMAFPIFVILIGLVVETTLILIAKNGTVYAAYAGARSRAVWEPAAADLAEAKVRRATLRALTPFAAGSARHLRGAGVSPVAGLEARLIGTAYRSYGGTISPSIIEAQYGYAEAATEVTLPGPGDEVAGLVDLPVRVTYHKPLYVPIIARLLGRPAPWPGASFRTYTITSEVALPEEAPRNQVRSLGIDYDSR